ncbi:MAG: hypothetical protein EBQ85_10690 [Proteobacteria bacterium]|nr:hypothetical protein [Pseudomonadota bacterium]
MESPSPVLEPADEISVVSESPRPSNFDETMQLLSQLGYQGVGLEHEDEATLKFIISVFSNPKSQNRNIRFVYTGLQLSYDREQFSLTLGENSSLAQTLKFIEKNIPFKK